MLRIGLMVPGAGISPPLPHSILKGGFHIEQARHVHACKNHEKEQGHYQCELGDGISGCSQNPSVPTGFVLEPKTAWCLACADRKNRRALQVPPHPAPQECSWGRGGLVTTFKPGHPSRES